jgi:hypothetical protein
LHWRQQPVSLLGDGLNYAWLFSLIFKNSAKLENRTREHALADEGVGPNRL